MTAENKIRLAGTATPDPVLLTLLGPRPYMFIRGATFCARERRHSMTMFSMKPKFNLAEFLAEPGPVGASRYSAARKRAMQVSRGETSEDATKTSPPTDSNSPNKKKQSQRHESS